jgi:bacteriorhodopsin
LLLLLTWGFYPIVYCLPLLPFSWATGPGAVVAVQSGYTIADMAAKAGYGLMIHHIARERTIHEGGVVSPKATAGDTADRATSQQRSSAREAERGDARTTETS